MATIGKGSMNGNKHPYLRLELWENGTFSKGIIKG
jgi:hypothetical protein